MTYTIKRKKVLKPYGKGGGTELEREEKDLTTRGLHPHLTTTVWSWGAETSRWLTQGPSEALQSPSDSLLLLITTLLPRGPFSPMLT